MTAACSPVADLDQLADDELDDVLPEVAVFARVTPVQKVRIVEAYQRGRPLRRDDRRRRQRRGRDPPRRRRHRPRWPRHRRRARDRRRRRRRRPHRDDRRRDRRRSRDVGLGPRRGRDPRRRQPRRARLHPRRRGSSPERRRSTPASSSSSTCSPTWLPRSPSRYANRPIGRPRRCCTQVPTRRSVDALARQIAIRAGATAAGATLGVGGRAASPVHRLAPAPSRWPRSSVPSSARRWWSADAARSCSARPRSASAALVDRRPDSRCEPVLRMPTARSGRLVHRRRRVGGRDGRVDRDSVGGRAPR